MLNGSKVLVIGGSSGIGLAIALACKQAGAEVIIASRDEQKLKKAQQKIGDNCSFIKCDISSADATNKLFEQIENIDHVVVSAGKPLQKNFLDINEQEARADIDINFWSKFNVVKAALGKLTEVGSILFVSGAFGKKPNPDYAATSIAAAAIESMTKTLAMSIGPKRVNAIAPFIIDTSDQQQAVSEQRAAYLQKNKDTLPAKYIGCGHDIGQAAVFLLSNPYSTGCILPLDGGYTIT